jgi:hypothetical protein
LKVLEQRWNFKDVCWYLQTLWHKDCAPKSRIRYMFWKYFSLLWGLMIFVMSFHFGESRIFIWFSSSMHFRLVCFHINVITIERLMIFNKQLA